MVKFNKNDYNKWKEFRLQESDLNQQEYKMVCKLHAKYYKHPIHYPCPCSPQTIKRYITELNVIFDNGY